MSAPAASGVEDLPARRGRRGRPGGRAFWRAAEWPLVGALIVVAVVLGYVGFKQYYDALGQHASPLDCLYFSLQLFTMNSSFAVAPIPWALQVARFLAPALAVYVAIKALLAVFRDQVWRLRARLFLKDHVVVCGLGARGVELTDQFLAQGCRVVAIESDVDNPLVESCRDRGAHVIVGDATDETVLRSAAVQTAGHLVAVLPEDGDNAEVAVRARRLKGDDDGRTLTAHVHMADLELCDLLRERDAENRPGSPFRLRFFNVMESGARMMLDEVSPNAPGRRRGRRYVVVGLGKMGRSLVQQAAREWPLVRRDAGDRLRLTLIDTAAGDKLELLRLRHPFLDDTCEIESLSLAKNAAEFERAAFLRGSDGEPADAVFLCFDDDVHVLASALTLDRRAGAAIPIVMRLSEKSGLAALFDDDSAGVIGGDLRPVPLLEWSCDPDLLLRGEGETLARALFAGAMSRGREAHEDGSGSRGATAAWNALGASQQDAWRGFAERLDDWLAAAGCRAWHSSGLMPEFAFTAEEAEALERQGWPLGDGDGYAIARRETDERPTGQPAATTGEGPDHEG